MKRLASLLVLGIWTATMAQVPPSADPDPGTAPQEPDSAAAAAGELQASEDDPVNPLPEQETDYEEPLAVEEDFNPDEEISEDYPVPLPSDI